MSKTATAPVFTAPRPVFATAAEAARNAIISDAPPGVDRGIFEEVLVSESRYFAIVWDKTFENTSRTRIVAAVVRGGRDTWFVSYREESDCPHTIACPPWLIDIAGAPPDEAAARWRDECRAFYERQAMPMGTILVFDAPVGLPDGRFETRFRFIPAGREDRHFVSCHSGRAYAIPDFAGRRWQTERVH